MNLVSIIIINWNGQSFIEECLISLKRQILKGYQIIIVDNSSDDNSLNMARKICPEAQFISLRKNYGFAIANNIGFDIVDTPYTALLNNDTVVDPQWLESLVTALEQFPDAGFAASRMLLYNDPNIIDRAGDTYCQSGTALLRGRGMPSDAFNQKEWIFGACAGAALYRTSMLKKIGLFDEDFFLLYEDVDLSFRAQLQGYRCLYVPEAVVYHHGSKSIGFDTPISIFYSHRNLEWVYFMNMPNKLFIKSFIPHLLYNLLAIVFFTAKGQFHTIARAKLAALKHIKKILKKRRLRQSQKIVSDDYLWSLMDKENVFERIKRRMK